MRQSKLFTKTRKEAPKDEVSKSAQLLIKAGFITKEMAGVYTILPLGLKTMEKIQKIIRNNMNKIGGVEMKLTALQDPENWKKTGRFDDEVLDVWFKTKLKNDTEIGLATTHEEPLTNLMREHISSYNDLPTYPYQFQTKFRNELRAKSGIMRGREFLMKDLYSFSESKEQHDEFYEKIKQAYFDIFEECGIGEQTFLTFASGGSFAKYSHEFQTETDAGEDIIYYSPSKKIAVNKEVYNDEVLKELELDKDELVEKKTAETGNIFTLGTRFSEPLELIFDDKEGERKPVFMGSYGIGIGRLMGVISEIYADDKGLVWPESVSPYDIHLVNVSVDNEDAVKLSEEIYEHLNQNGISVLYDDRNKGVGEKLGDADLIGITRRIVIGTKGMEAGEFDLYNRLTDKTEKVSESQIMNLEFIKKNGDNLK
jgi:prolyl-tRNA synthetase